jgi:hypothetical protein
MNIGIVKYNKNIESFNLIKDFISNSSNIVGNISDDKTLLDSMYYFRKSVAYSFYDIGNYDKKEIIAYVSIYSSKFNSIKKDIINCIYINKKYDYVLDDICFYINKRHPNIIQWYGLKYSTSFNNKFIEHNPNFIKYLENYFFTKKQKTLILGGCISGIVARYLGDLETVCIDNDPASFKIFRDDIFSDKIYRNINHIIFFLYHQYVFKEQYNYTNDEFVIYLSNYLNKIKTMDINTSIILGTEKFQTKKVYETFSQLNQLSIDLLKKYNNVGLYYIDNYIEDQKEAINSVYLADVVFNRLTIDINRRIKND